jgi:hypothetical protein
VAGSGVNTEHRHHPIRQFHPVHLSLVTLTVQSDISRVQVGREDHQRRRWHVMLHTRGYACKVGAVHRQ